MCHLLAESLLSCIDNYIFCKMTSVIAVGEYPLAELHKILAFYYFSFISYSYCHAPTTEVTTTLLCRNFSDVSNGGAAWHKYGTSIAKDDDKVAMQFIEGEHESSHKKKQRTRQPSLVLAIFRTFRGYFGIGCAFILCYSVTTFMNPILLKLVSIICCCFACCNHCWIRLEHVASGIRL